MAAAPALTAAPAPADVYGPAPGADVPRNAAAKRLASQTRALIAAGRLDDALRMCNIAVDTGREATEDETAPTRHALDADAAAVLLCDCASAMLTAGRVSDAAACIRKALALQPTAHARSRACVLLDSITWSADPRGAQALGMRELASRRADAHAAKEEGNRLYKVGRLDEAIEWYSYAIDIDGQDVTFYTNRAAAYLERGMFYASVVDCRKALRLAEMRYPGTSPAVLAKAHARLATGLARMGRTADAVASYRASLAVSDSEEVRRRMNATMTATALTPWSAEGGAGDELPPDAVMRATAAMDGQEERAMADALFKEGKYREAIRYYDMALRRDMHGPIADRHLMHVCRALAFSAVSRRGDAMDACDAAIAADPGQPEGYLVKSDLLAASKPGGGRAALQVLLGVYSVWPTELTEHLARRMRSALVTCLQQDRELMQTDTPQAHARLARDVAHARALRQIKEVQTAARDPRILALAIRLVRSDAVAVIESLGDDMCEIIALLCRLCLAKYISLFPTRADNRVLFVDGIMTWRLQTTNL
eukprot:Opistho-1_new@286